MKYRAIVHENENGPGYWGEVPALPGCCSEGNSLQELEINLREAILGCLAVIQEDS